MTQTRFGRHRTTSTPQQRAAAVTEQDAKLAREMRALLAEVGQLLEATSEWADDAIAGGQPPRWVAQQLIEAERMIASAARGDEPQT